VGGGYNPTTPTNVFEERLFDQLDSNVVVIASVNLGGPSRNYLKKRESFVDARVQEYLEDAGYEVRAQREFSQRWNNAVLIYGDPIDPTTGRVNQKSFIQIVQAVRDQLRDQTDIGSIVFTDIIEKDVYYEQGLNRVTRFDGVTRKPAVQGAGSGVTAEFDWSRPVAAATMRIAWFNTGKRKSHRRGYCYRLSSDHCDEKMAGQPLIRPAPPARAQYTTLLIAHRAHKPVTV